MLLIVIAAFPISKMPINSNQDFDGLFAMDVLIGQHYSDVAWCTANGALGCANEYLEDNAGCEIDGNECCLLLQ